MRTLLLVAAVGVWTSVSRAQTTARADRMPPIPAADLTPEQQAAIVAFRAARGKDAAIAGPFTPLLRSPEVMQRARALGDYLRFKSALPPRLSEFVILMTAREWTQRYEWAVHYPIALAAGVKPDMARAIAEGRRPAGMSTDEETLFDFCAELEHNKSVSDATYARAVAAFGEKGVIDTIGIVGYYTLLAMTMNVAQTPGGTNGAPPLRRLPE